MSYACIKWESGKEVQCKVNWAEAASTAVYYSNAPSYIQV